MSQTGKLNRTKWLSNDERTLLRIWERYETELRQNKRNSHIYVKMAGEMAGKHTPSEIHVKINNMTQRYRSEKNQIGLSGGCPSKWEHYDAVHKIVGKNASSNRSSVESFNYIHSDSERSSTSAFEWPSAELADPLDAPTAPVPSTSSVVPLPILSPADSVSSTPLKSSRTKWNSNDERTLLRIWERYETELRENKRNSHIYVKMAGEMAGKHNPSEIHVKINNMTQRYRSEKNQIGLSGGCPSKWEHYDAVHKIVGKNASSNRSSVESFNYIHSDSERSSTSAFEWPSAELADPLDAPAAPVPSTSSVVPLPILSPADSVSSTPPLSPTTPPPTNSAIPSTSSSAKKRKNEILQSILTQIQITKENQQILKNISEDNKNLCDNFGRFLEKQEENDKLFLEYFKKMVEKL